jgi:hypothetical protein
VHSIHSLSGHWLSDKHQQSPSVQLNTISIVLGLIDLAHNLDTFHSVCHYLNVFDLILLAVSHPQLFKQIYEHAKSIELWQHLPLIRLSHQHEVPSDDVQIGNKKQRTGRTKKKKTWPSQLMYRIDQILINNDCLESYDPENMTALTIQASRVIGIAPLPSACADAPRDIWSHLL